MSSLAVHRVQAVFFDLDGTLRHNTPSAENTLNRIAAEMGATLSPAQAHQAARWAHYYWAQSPELRADIAALDFGSEAFWVNYAYRYLLALGVENAKAKKLAPLLSARMETDYTPESTVHREDLAMLAALRERGLALGLISNRTHPFDDELKELGLHSYFDFAYTAGEVNAWKPDPAIFERAFALSGLQPEQALYIGDNYFADVVGAREAGMQPVLLDRRGLFPEADCPTIRTLTDLLTLLPDGDKTSPRD